MSKDSVILESDSDKINYNIKTGLPKQKSLFTEISTRTSVIIAHSVGDEQVNSFHSQESPNQPSCVVCIFSLKSELIVSYMG